MKINLTDYLSGKAREIIRYGIVAILFIGIITIQGMSNIRQSHQIIFMLAMMGLFSLVLKNIWITMFLLWTIFLYSFFKFTTGNIYLAYVFYGCIFYLITKIAFTRKDINFFINGFLWFVFINIVYMSFQVLGFDFIFNKIFYFTYVKSDYHLIQNTIPYGFMGNYSTAAFLIAVAIPMLATRGSKMAWVGAFMLFIPLYAVKTSLCLLMGIIGLLFVLYFRIPKWLLVLIIIIGICFEVFYVKKVDNIGTERFKQWHHVMRDAWKHPVSGWGLDSFANETPQKKFRYAQNIDKYAVHRDLQGRQYKDVTHITWWDNPHNLYISLFYEFGGVGLFLFIAYLYQYGKRFQYSIKDSNTIALAGFIIVFLGISIGHFPAFLARTMVFIIPSFALFEVSTE